MALLLPDYWADFIRSGPIEDVKPLGVAPGGGEPLAREEVREGAHRVRTEDRYRDRGVDEPRVEGKEDTKYCCWDEARSSIAGSDVMRGSSPGRKRTVTKSVVCTEWKRGFFIKRCSTVFVSWRSGAITYKHDPAAARGVVWRNR